MSGVRRFKADPPLEAGVVVLRGEEARHLRTVLRARDGDRVVLFDGAGREADAEVVEPGRDEASCRTVGRVRLVPPPKCRVELVCGLPRAGAADDVVRVAVEVGASAIRPLVTERGVWRPDDDAESERSVRFERAAVAALKQGGLSWMPEFLPPVRPAELRVAPGAVALLGSVRPEAAPVAAVLAREPRGPGRPLARALVIVGPEGGLTGAEEAALVAAGATRVRAGAGTLRVETAVIVLVSQLLCAAAAAPE